jgi:ABC-type phosphate transport system substrate-binding protein
VLHDKRAICYAGLASGQALKHLRIKADKDAPAVEPSAENVKAVKYPLSRLLHWYLVARPSGATKDLCLWAVSPEAQSIAESLGFVPLSEEERARSRSHL